ncbi:MAG TPA: S8 family peptidase [Oligoflexus sp.]|uniref:S8 family peptidase n=1 Tax=Oligoflexus sp. TaxID=1971216 RepID=UPI002D237E74|nr:S8 family peptidase [Oligoflexus sp.]HYX35398.1 S8 family peptidase [Oligoflexus sp.]
MKTRHASRLVCVGLGLALAACGHETDESELASPEHGSNQPKAIYLRDSNGSPMGLASANEVLVQYKLDANNADKKRVKDKVRGSRKNGVHSKVMKDNGEGELELVELPIDQTLEAALEDLKDDPALTFAEPNFIYQHTAVSNDPFFTNGSLFGMYGNTSTPANAFGSQAGEAWTKNQICNNGVYVGVIDEGIMTTHEDLVNNIWVNPFDPVDGRDNDGNGLIDDTNGWDFAANNRSVFDGPSDDHGTHVAGTIGAKGGNGKGVAGVCWSVTLISAKFLGQSGGSTLGAIRAIDYFTDLKRRHGLNIVATNNSWGGGGFSLSLKNAIDRANAAGILFVAAAGNGGSDGISDNNDTTPSYPASYTSSNIISVAALNNRGQLASFSNFGATSVDIGAPGSGIVSTVPSATSTSAYASFSGTSMATPHVTGAVALFASLNPGATAAQIKAAILGSAVPTPAVTGKCVTGGRLNLGDF